MKRIVGTISRIFNNILNQSWRLKYHFPKEELKKLEFLIGESEQKHQAQIKLLIESNMPILDIVLQKTPKERAINYFSSLNIWDTEYNLGILIYLLLSEKRIEIVVDRGISKIISDELWQKLCVDACNFFKQKLYVQGLNQLLSEMSKILEKNVAREKEAYINEITNDIVIK